MTAQGLTRTSVFFQWGVSSYFGWGVYGLNLMVNLADDPVIRAIPSSDVRRERIVLDPADMARIEPLLALSDSFCGNLRPVAGQTVTINHPVMHSLGGNLVPFAHSAHKVHLVSDRMVGVVFLENTTLTAEARHRAASYAVIVAGSHWNEQVLRGAGIDNVVTVLQGVNHALFRPGHRLGIFGDRFAVFSGGKLEYRKGQDLVLAAFKRFHARHPDSVLVTAWHSPWEDAYVRTLDVSPHVSPVPVNNGVIDVTGWAVANGLPAEAIVDLGSLPNRAMPSIYTEMDVALFPNRSEGGTNLVAMEVMACGIPAVVSANTGHLDLIEGDSCLPLRRQRPIGRPGTDGWGESEIEEILDALERLYQDRALARAIGAGGAALMSGWGWRPQILRLKDTLMSALL